MERLMFVQNVWKRVRIPKGHDPSWVEADFLYYARCWASAQEKGFSDKRSEQLAEAFVSKRLYPGITYEKELEKDILSLMS
jgi:hypothetical protein